MIEVKNYERNIEFPIEVINKLNERISELKCKMDKKFLLSLIIFVIIIGISLIFSGLNIYSIIGYIVCLNFILYSFLPELFIIKTIKKKKEFNKLNENVNIILSSNDLKEVINSLMYLGGCNEHDKFNVFKIWCIPDYDLALLVGWRKFEDGSFEKWENKILEKLKKELEKYDNKTKNIDDLSDYILNKFKN